MIPSLSAALKMLPWIDPHEKCEKPDLWDNSQMSGFFFVNQYADTLVIENNYIGRLNATYGSRFDRQLSERGSDGL